MPTQLTPEHVTQSLSAHVAAKGEELYQKYGPTIGWKELLQILADRACVRYPCEIQFDAAPLQPGEGAYPTAKGERPEDGFILYLHPIFMSQLHAVPHLALYQIVAINYGDFASAHDAEMFGAAALGLDKEEYYRTLCSLHDSLPGSAASGMCSRSNTG